MRYSIVLCVLLQLVCPLPGAPPDRKTPPTENDYYRLISFPLPENLVLEVGGMDFLDKEKTKLLVCTRRGEIWRIENLYHTEPALEGKPLKVPDGAGKTREVLPEPAQIVRFHQMLFGLHEPLGLLVRGNGVYLAQRGELTRVADT